MLAAAVVSLVKQLATIETEGVFRIVLGSNLLPRAQEVDVDLGLFATALSLGVATSVVFGVLPALHVSNAAHVQAIGSRGGGTARRDTRARGALVVASSRWPGAAFRAACSRTASGISRRDQGSTRRTCSLFSGMPDEIQLAQDEVVTRCWRGWAPCRHTAAVFAYAGICRHQNTFGWLCPRTNACRRREDGSRPRLKREPGLFDTICALCCW